jgi:V/A-type H+-transporting ATPase subunit I
MIWSMLFGVVHLFAGMGAKAWILFLTGRGKDAVLDVFPWYLIITGAGLMVGGIGGQAGQIMAIAGAAVLVLFGGRDARNPFMRLIKGLLSLYNITSYVSDILSYTRILALVLATSVIAMVVNLLGFMGGPSITGFLFYVLVAILGHGLNLALSSLSAYVHTSRLHYVEFFGKFYDGGGRLWNPLKIKTRYVDIVRTQPDT